MTTFHAEHGDDEISLDLPTTDEAADSRAPLGNPADDADAAGLAGLTNNIGPLLEQARAALQAGEITTPEFLERVAPLLERIHPTPADEPTPTPGLAALGQSLAPIVRAGSGLGVVGLGLGVLALAGGAFALGAMARPAASR